MTGWKGIDEKHIEQIIPDSLHIFLGVLLGGTAILECEEDSDTYDKQRLKMFNLAQDIIYTVSNYKKLTPKHVGLGLTVHHATRSEALIDLLHAAGNTIGIDTIHRIDTSIASSILNKYEDNGYIYIPNEIYSYEKGGLIICSADNIDVLEETLDGKNTFHATQMVIWQRKPAMFTKEEDVNSGKIGRPKALKAELCKKLHELDKDVTSRSRPEPNLEFNVAPEKWFDETLMKHSAKAKFKDLAWVLLRSEENVPSWGQFNEVTSKVDPPLTTAGMLPILQAPADNDDTMTTVINRFQKITEKLGQTYTVLVFDQPLYSRAKEIIWKSEEKYKNVIVLLGDLHILFNFLKAIGQHFENAGLQDIWTDSGLFAANSTEAMLNGKAYYRSVRGHLLTYEALWRIKWEKFTQWLMDTNNCIPDLHLTEIHCLFDRKPKRYDNEIFCAVEKLMEELQHPVVSELLWKFDNTFNEESNFKFWNQYISMVQTLLNFIRANRDGNWQLHLESFAEMLPWMTIYDHTNYARWGPVYMTDMKNLHKTAPEVLKEFEMGNFVVKRSSHQFNQVPVDQATEWVNRMCKISNGIIGITKNDPARDRFCTTWSERSHISNATKDMFGIKDDDNAISTRKEALPSRMKLDHDCVNTLVKQFKRFNVFNTVSSIVEEEQDTIVGTKEGPTLVSLATNDLATWEIEECLLQAYTSGKQLVVANTTKRLIEKTVSFYSPLVQNNTKTFGNMYQTKITSSKQNITKSVKADRKLIQRLLNASMAGRDINMEDILKYELSNYPLSLVKTNGMLNSANKADMLKLLTKDLEVQIRREIPQTKGKTCVLIDGHALIQALGKPHGCQTFNDYGNVFFASVTKYFKSTVSRIDLVFDRYQSDSIKNITRNKRVKKKKPIRKIIHHGDIRLPQVWDQFLSLGVNKADLANFLSELIISKGNDLCNGQEIVISGGFTQKELAKSTTGEDIKELQCNHEEADTRLVLHANHALNKGYEKLEIRCQDTDVMLLMIHFFGGKNKNIWMIGGSSKEPKCYPVHDIADKLSQTQRQNILGFHSLTGSDTTSSFTGYGKKKCWKIYKEFPELLAGIGRNGAIEPVEEYICRLYGIRNVTSGVIKGRFELFMKGKKDIECLPPTYDALKLHLSRCNYQAKIWLQSNIAVQELEDPINTGGWIKGQSGLEIKWTSLPSIPDVVVELTTCGCTTKCKTAACKCYVQQQICTSGCGCYAEMCRNPMEMTSGDGDGN